MFIGPTHGVYWQLDDPPEPLPPPAPPYTHHSLISDLEKCASPFCRTLYISETFSWSHSGLWDCRLSQTATCPGNVCHRNSCSRGSVQEFQFAPLQLHFLLWQHSLDVSIATLGVLWLSCTCSWFYALNLIALLLIVDVHLWGSVQFLAQTGPVLCSHAFRLCTIPLVFYHFIDCCIMLSVWGVFMVRKTNMMHFS